MTKLTTLYHLIKQWRKDLERMQQLQQQHPDLVNSQAIEVMKKMVNSTRKEYIDRGGRRPV